MACDLDIYENTQGVQIEDYWKTSQLGQQQPIHPITKWMPLRRFQLLSWNLRLFDYATIDESNESSF
jgi:hypothetical protein